MLWKFCLCVSLKGYQKLFRLDSFHYAEDIASQAPELNHCANLELPNAPGSGSPMVGIHRPRGLEMMNEVYAGLRRLGQAVGTSCN